jgi:hypothetical protein
VLAVVVMLNEIAAEGCTPSRVTDAGVNAHAAFAGNPEHAKVTVCVDPFTGVNVNVTGPALFPAATLTVAGEAALIVNDAGPPAFTVCVNAADVLPANVASPPYCAVIAYVPALTNKVANVATPLPFNVPVPIELPLSRNVTDPVGVPIPEVGATVAVNVTDAPTVEGFAEELSVTWLAVVPTVAAVHTFMFAKTSSTPPDDEDVAPTSSSGRLSPFKSAAATVIGRCPNASAPPSNVPSPFPIHNSV